MKVLKDLAGAEDLLLDAELPDTVTQSRGGSDYIITKVNAKTIPYTGTFGQSGVVSIKDKLDNIDTSLDLRNSVSRNTIEDLKLETGLVFNTINVLGYYTPGDGGGGTFYWDSTSTEPDNGGTIIQPTGINIGRWKMVFSGAVNVRWFGAKGDGVTDDTTAVQKSMDYATLLNNAIYISNGIYKINGMLSVKCSVFGEDKATTFIKFTNNGVKENSIVLIGDSDGLEICNLSIDNGCSSDPIVWNLNYDNFTGRYGLRTQGTHKNLNIHNLNFTNTFQASIATYGITIDSKFDNISTNRNRGNFGDGFYFPYIKNCKVTNCTAYDFTRIGFVTDDSLNENTPIDSIFQNCKAEYGHDYSYLHGGGEFNSGIWCENSTNIVIESCYFKNIAGRGVTVTTGNFSNNILQDGAFYNISNVICENTDNAFVCESLNLVNNNVNISNCTAILNKAADIRCSTYGSGLTLNVNVNNFTSEKIFTGLPQSRVIEYSADNLTSVINLSVNNISVTSDFNKSTFNYSSSTGHIGVYSNIGTVNLNISNIDDKNGVLFNSQIGQNDTGTIIIGNVKNLHIYSVICSSLKIDNCTINTFSGWRSYGEDNTIITNSIINADTFIASNDTLVDSCILNMPDSGRFYCNNYFAVSTPSSRIRFRLINSIINKNYTGSVPYSIEFSTKDSPDKAGLVIDNCIFNNTSSSGINAYPLYTSNGYSNFLGTSYIDSTIQYFLKNYSTLETSSNVFTKITLQ